MAFESIRVTATSEATPNTLLNHAGGATVKYASITIFLYNTHATNSESITLYAVKSGASASETNRLMKIDLLPGEAKIISAKTILNNGDKIQAIGSVGSCVSATISYYEEILSVV